MMVNSVVATNTRNAKPTQVTSRLRMGSATFITIWATSPAAEAPTRLLSLPSSMTRTSDEG